MDTISVEHIQPSKLNPRRHFDPAGLEDLARSMRAHGVLEPLVVRSTNGSRAGADFELVCGERRLRAAKLAGLAEVPAIVRTLSDTEVLEIMVIENLQRDDLHPLEEAEGYRRLMTTSKYDVAKIAEKIGRSVKYVYDRVKLLQLTKEAQQLFLEGKITAGHAILLARLKPKQQERALDPGEQAVFQQEDLLWDMTENFGTPFRRATPDSVKPRSVRELSTWIDRNIRFDPKKPDPMLFPEAAAELKDAPKVVAITYLSYIPDQAREGRTYFPQSWKRADGKEKSKKCDHSVIGFVAVGPHRGEAFDVCVKKDRCEVHWAAYVKRAQQRAKAKPAAAAAAAPAAAPARDNWAKRNAEEQRRKAEAWTRWKKALPAIVKATQEAVSKASASAQGPLGQLLVRRCSRYGESIAVQGRTLEDLVRHLVVNWAIRAARSEFSFAGDFRAMAKTLGIDWAKILKAEVPAGPRAAKKATPRKKRGAR